MSARDFLYIIPLLPLVGCVINGLAGKRLPRSLVGPIACAGPLAALALSAVWFFDARALEPGESIRCEVARWIEVGDLSIPFAFTLDRLSAVMLLVVTGVGSLIHIYSIGYMREDPGHARFFAYLNLFMAMMLILVLGSSLPLLFLGWEGVGLCSYLLIGFWYDDLANSQAGKKAFIVNRVGDVFFAIGMFFAFTTYGSLEFGVINEAAAAGRSGAEEISGVARFWIPLLLFIGATGKSAQIPLFVWLPDAMAGPTPVSALIHAATMVTSGVYLLNRAAPVFEASPEVLLIVAIVGALTALVAGFIALTQCDIKKVLAYSTVSQLGYMFLACGLGAFSLGMFHVVTHAFFKGLLFLGAGAIIVSMHHEQDMRRMGGLRKKIPITFALMGIGSLAIAGMPPLAGFFSKDHILVAASEKALHGDAWTGLYLALWIVGLLTAALTSFYTFRLMAMTFYGKPHHEAAGHGEAHTAASEGDSGHDAPGGHAHGHAHGGPIVESPRIMLAPMGVLALLSIVGGFLAVDRFLAPVEPHGGWLSWLGMALGTLAFLLGLAGAWFFYGKAPARRLALVEDHPLGRAIYRLSRGKLYVDELYDACIVRPLSISAQILFIVVDRILIDWLLVSAWGGVTRGLGGILRRIQSGRAPTYAAWLVAGGLALLFMVLASM